MYACPNLLVSTKQKYIKKLILTSTHSYNFFFLFLPYFDIRLLLLLVWKNSAWSTETRRGAYAIDTCGGCGEVGTHGSGAQRLAMILASGPPDQSSLSSTSSSLSDDVEVDYDGLLLKGEARSQAFPSPTLINIEVRKDNVDSDDKEQPYTVYIASSDGMGCSSKAKVIDGGLQLETSALYGCGWGAGTYTYIYI